MSATKELKKGAKIGVGNLTENDLRLVVIAWNCLEDQKIDLAKFTKATEYANSTSARVCLNGTKRKLSTYFANLTAEKKADKEVDKEAKKEDGATITPAPTAGKRKAADSSDGEDDFPISAAAKRQRKAAKKPATRKGKKQAALDAYSQEDNYDDYAAESD
ncbi:hypothetical protein KJ359_002474 [Pestalotiopsis sp. 9143b]|nr:hypothetical protein KJ359_002474 [Pestalotiopsis sp. 9143b]